MHRERILVVDDAPDVVELCRRILASEGYLVKGATSGQEGALRPPSGGRQDA